MPDLWSHLSHHQLAIYVGLALAAACSLLSVFIVLRKMAMIAESVAHAGIGGIGVALLLGYAFPAANNSLVMQLVTGLFCLGTALLIGYVTRGKHVSEDSAIGIFLVAAMALGILLISIRNKFPPIPGQPRPASLENILFGDINSVTSTEAWIALAAMLLVFTIVLALYHEFLYTTLDEEMARINGVNTSFINALLLAMISLVIVVGVRMVGAMMITALTILPGATARMLSGKFNGVLVLSLLVGIAGVGIGLVAAVNPPLYEYTSGPVLVLTLFLIFALTWLARRFLKPRPADQPSAPLPPGHDHVHTPPL